ncbi:MAG: transposase, partial [Alphaproteobacteria bacterium]
MEKKRRRHFPDEFKRQAVERALTSGLPLFEVTAALGVHESQLRRWARQFGQTTALTTRRRPSRETPGLSPADLAAENARLPAC